MEFVHTLIASRRSIATPTNGPLGTANTLSSEASWRSLADEMSVCKILLNSVERLLALFIVDGTRVDRLRGSRGCVVKLSGRPVRGCGMMTLFVFKDVK